VDSGAAEPAMVITLCLLLRMATDMVKVDFLIVIAAMEATILRLVGVGVGFYELLSSYTVGDI